MPRVRGKILATYSTDGGTGYNSSVDRDSYAVTSRGWTPGTPGGPHMPRAFKPRHVTGLSATSGRRGTAVVATLLADLWTGVATTFDVEADDGTIDTMDVISRQGEKPSLP